LTQRQTIAKAYVILNKTRRFKNDITEWNRKPEIQKTWINFKTHFRRAHQEFRETTDITLEESDLHRNNVNLVQEAVHGLQQAMIAEPPTDDPADLQLQLANSVTNQQQLNHQLQRMQQAMALLTTQVAAQQSAPPLFSPQYFPPFQSRGGHSRATFGTQGQGGIGDGGRSRQRNMSIYCWTHGSCGHTSAACLTKLPGHQDAATFSNNMEGNPLRCPPT
jgi:hypothetical protein